MNMVVMRLGRKWETVLLPSDERLRGASRRFAFHADRTARVELAIVYLVKQYDRVGCLLQRFGQNAALLMNHHHQHHQLP